MSALLDSLVTRRWLSPAAAAYLKVQVQTGRSLVICGPQGQGRTALLNALLAECPLHKRIVMCEQRGGPSGKTQPRLMSPYWQRTVARAGVPNSLAHAIREALALVPERIVVDEIHDAAIIELLRARSSLFSVCAADPLFALRRLAAMARADRTFATWTLPDLMRLVAAGLHLLIHVGPVYTTQGNPHRLLSISHVCLSPGQQVEVEPVFDYDARLGQAIWLGAHPVETALQYTVLEKS